MADLSIGKPLTSDDPSRIDSYALKRRLGIGGMGVVYLAQDPSGEQVAVKVVRPELSHQRHFQVRFAREVQAMRKVSGEHIARLLDAQTEGDTQWLAMEYVPGPTLYDYVLDHGPLPTKTVKDLAVGLADALQSIHQAGMIHRDLKPSNVILSPTGPKVLDFGIAHVMDATALTSTGQQIGSIAWMAPEQLVDGTETNATDVHAWGAVVHFAATGLNPYGEGRPQALAVRISNGQSSLTSLGDSALDALLKDSLASDPGSRPTTEQILHSIDDGTVALDYSDQQAVTDEQPSSGHDDEAEGELDQATWSSVGPVGWRPPQTVDDGRTRVLPNPGPTRLDHPLRPTAVAPAKVKRTWPLLLVFALALMGMVGAWAFTAYQSSEGFRTKVDDVLDLGKSVTTPSPTPTASPVTALPPENAAPRLAPPEGTTYWTYRGGAQVLIRRGGVLRIAVSNAGDIALCQKLRGTSDGSVFSGFVNLYGGGDNPGENRSIRYKWSGSNLIEITTPEDGRVMRDTMLTPSTLNGVNRKLRGVNPYFDTIKNLVQSCSLS